LKRCDSLCVGLYPAVVLLIVFTPCKPAVCGPIHDAVKAGDKQKVEALLSKSPALLSSRDGELGATPLHWAAAKGDLEIARLLIEKKALVDAPNNEGLTPLHIAVANDKKEMVRLLLANGANVNRQSLMGRLYPPHGEFTPLHLAAKYGNKDMALLLMTNGANPNLFDQDRETPDTIAAFAGNDDLATVIREYAFKDENIAHIAGTQWVQKDSAGRVTLLDFHSDGTIGARRISAHVFVDRTVEWDRIDRQKEINQNGTWKQNGTWEQVRNQVHVHPSDDISKDGFILPGMCAEIEWSGSGGTATQFKLHERKPDEMNRSETSDGDFLVHVYSVATSKYPLSVPTGYFRDTANGLIQQERTIEPPSGFEFLSIVIGSETETARGGIPLRKFQLKSASGDEIAAIRLFSPIGELSAVTNVGREFYLTAEEGLLGLAGVTFLVPAGRSDELLFSVDSTEVGSVGELKSALKLEKQRTESHPCFLVADHETAP